MPVAITTCIVLYLHKPLPKKKGARADMAMPFWLGHSTLDSAVHSVVNW